LIGESNGMGIPKNSKDLYGSSLKIKLYERLFDTYTVNAPFEPFEGLIVPDM
jgi:hypothetical protein